MTMIAGESPLPRPPWTPVYTPRPWQDRALARWTEKYRGIVAVVTGGGKTAFAELCMLRFKEQFPAGHFLIIVPTVTLLDQWYVALTEELAVPTKDLACYSGEERPQCSSLVNIMVINTARSHSKRVAAGKTIMLIVDECHRAGSKVNSLALAINPTATLGLSATPEREHDEGLNERLVPALGDVIFKYSYSDAHRDRVIVPFELINVRIPFLPDEAKVYKSLTRRAGMELNRIRRGVGSEDRLKRILLNRAAAAAGAALRVPVAAKLAESKARGRTIVFHERISAADRLAKLLEECGHRVTTYHSRIGPAVRRDNLRLYRQGMFDVLVTCRALDEGVNIPEATMAIVASSTASARQRIQRMGRVLRPAKGKHAATVFTLYVTEGEERRLRDEAKSLAGVATVKWQRSTVKSNG